MKTITVLILLLFSSPAFSSGELSFDLKEVPFSTRGSYFALSQIRERVKTDSLFLHHFIGLGTRTLFSFHPLEPGGSKTDYRLKATPSSLTMTTASGRIEICFENDKTLRIRVEGAGLLMKTDAFRIPMYRTTEQFRLPGYNRYDRLMVTLLRGSMEVKENESIDDEKFDAHHQTREMGTDYIRIFSDDSGPAELVLEEYVSEWKPREYNLSFEQCLDKSRAEFIQFLGKSPGVGEEFLEARDLAMYINWSSIVRRRGVMNRDGMLMSKNHMNYLWSWDNCFNAIAMAQSHPYIAWDQIMVVFDNQDELGILPDRFRDVFIHFGFTKPPVYGIAIDNLRSAGILTLERKEEVYEPLVKLTEFWFRYRDDDKDGFPQYHHGNDSGWDNGTVFDVGYPVEGPDLSTFLVLQMDALSRLARDLGKEEESLNWKERSDALAEKILDVFYKNGKFVYLSYPEGNYNQEGHSLLSYIPMLLGDRMPEWVIDTLFRNFKESGLITPYGVATESPESPLYERDGYWRGPIWAPSTFLIVKGVKNCGEETLARDIAVRFCRMCLENGFAENFDALSGEGLRDPSYTWTSSVFLHFLEEFDL